MMEDRTLLVLILSAGALGLALLAFAYYRKLKHIRAHPREPYIRRLADREERKDTSTKFQFLTEQGADLEDRTKDIERWHRGFQQIAENTGEQLLEIYSKLQDLNRRVLELEGKRFTQP
jgi:hypothetical protein